jgi:hypothetical protein
MKNEGGNVEEKEEVETRCSYMETVQNSEVKI